MTTRLDVRGINPEGSIGVLIVNFPINVIVPRDTIKTPKDGS